MKHSEIRAHLSAYLERDLSPEARSQIETHLESCAACASELRELRATVSLLRRLPEPGHPPGLAEAVMARVARDGSRPAPVIWLLRRAAEPRIAVALAAGLAGLFFLVRGGAPGLSPPPTIAAIEIARDGLTPTDPSGAAQTASTDSRAARSSESFPIVLRNLDEPRPRSVRSPRPGIQSRTTPRGNYAEYARSARFEEVARLLRGAGHPYSDSLASHFDERPTVAMADWHPR